MSLLSSWASVERGARNRALTRRRLRPTRPLEPGPRRLENSNFEAEVLGRVVHINAVALAHELNADAFRGVDDQSVVASDMSNANVAGGHAGNPISDRMSAKAAFAVSRVARVLFTIRFRSPGHLAAGLKSVFDRAANCRLQHSAIDTLQRNVDYIASCGQGWGAEINLSGLATHGNTRCKITYFESGRRFQSFGINAFPDARVQRCLVART